jgi:hypothetical protein
MFTNENDITFDPQGLIDSLIDEMGLRNETPEKVAALKEKMMIQIAHIVLSTAAMHVEPEVYDKVLGYAETIKDPAHLYAELIKGSEEAQIAILQALYEFKNQTLDAYRKIKKS